MLSVSTKLLRLAHAKPALRKHLLPLLRSAGVALTPEQETFWDRNTRTLSPTEKEMAKDHLFRHKGQPIFGTPSFRYGQRVEFNTKLWLVYDITKAGSESRLILVSPDVKEMTKGVPEELV